MSRDVHDAHFQHERHGLSLLVRPPVGLPVALAWDAKGTLLAATADGQVHRVHPAMGTTRLLSGLGQPAGLGVEDDRFCVVERGGRWALHDASGNLLIDGEHPFEGPVHVTFRQNKVLLTGTVGPEKQVLFFDGGRKVMRIQLPARAVAFVSGGHLGLAQSTPVGLETIYVKDNGRFHGRETTPHLLVPEGDHVLGLHAGGVRVWSILEGTAYDVAVANTSTAAVTPDGRMVAVGTSQGEIALSALGEDGTMSAPDVVEATDAPVRALAFSRKGKWLASGAEQLVLWTWS